MQIKKMTGTMCPPISERINMEANIEITYMTWSDVVGLTPLTENLQNAIKYNKISHAYLIQGERLSGKRMLADIFARALQCEGDRAPSEYQATLFDLETEKRDKSVKMRPCNQCRSCKQAINKNHPDIIYVTHEKPNVISVDNIRQQVNADIGIKPYSGDYKIYIIDKAEKMNVQAQNALLKTLEEPPGYAVILLLVTRAETMLQTILSRCVVLNIKPVPENLIKQYLMQRVQVPDYKAAVCASFARGNVGRAIELASNKLFDQMKSSVLDLLRHISDMELNQIVSEVKKITEEKFDTNDYLDLCYIWFRDVLLLKASGVSDSQTNLIFKEHLTDVAKAAEYYSYERIEKIIHSIDVARNRIAVNVNFDLTMELMFFEMKAG